MKRKSIAAAAAAVLSAANLFCFGQVGVAASDSPLAGCIWLGTLPATDTRAFYQFHTDGSGAVSSTETGETLPLTWRMQGSSSATIQIGDSLCMNVSIQCEAYSSATLLWADGSTTKLSYLQHSAPEDAARSYKAGDLSQDGNLSEYDAVLLQQAILGEYAVTPFQRALGDLNGNGKLDEPDICLFKRKLAAQTKTNTHQPEIRAEQPDSVYLPVMNYSQHPDYPTGCECIALYILLQYYHTDVTPEQLVDALPKGALPARKDGVLYGANPEREFVGDPRTDYAFGVFNQPIAAVAEQFRSGAKTKTGASLEELLAIVDSGNPVVAWYTMSPTAGLVYSYKWCDDQTFALIEWPGNEHAVVVCGHDAETLTYRDPNTGTGKTVTQADFRRVFDELGGRIVYYEQ